MPDKSFDIIIIGGGVVGLTAACALAETQLSIAVIDHQTSPTPGIKTNYDLRVSALNIASQHIFQSLQVWELMRELRISDYQTMHVWDAGSPARISFDHSEIMQPYLGHVVEQSVMRQALWAQLQRLENVQLYPATTVTSLTENTETVSVQLENSDILHGKLLVGADGGNSWVAKKTGLRTSSQTHPTHSAVVTTLRTEKPHEKTALQRFLANGPVALLPLNDMHLVSLVWSTTTDEAKRLQELSEQEFNDELSKATEYSLGKLAVCDQRSVFPLLRHHVKHYVKPRIALIGDAAHTILPLAGQGVNLGILDAACLAEVIQEAIGKKRDMGTLPVLRRYERWRKGENAGMLLAMEGFQQLFTNNFAPARYLRYFGFALTEKLTRVKQYFMLHAAGLRGDLPQRCKLV